MFTKQKGNIAAMGHNAEGHKHQFCECVFAHQYGRKADLCCSDEGAPKVGGQKDATVA